MHWPTRWLPIDDTRFSKKNGSIRIRRTWFGHLRVIVNKSAQTGPYTRAMWTDCYTRLAGWFPQKQSLQILMLGLGAAGEIPVLHRAFPESLVTAVEYDPEMIALAHSLEFYQPYPFPEVVQGDAREVVPRLLKKFDLIMIDLFYGEEPSPLCTDEVFLKHVRNLLSPHGVVVINVCRRKESLDTALTLFPHSKVWQFRLNFLGAFRQEQKAPASAFNQF